MNDQNSKKASSIDSSDRPIKRCKDDELRRIPFAEAIANQAALVPADEGFVIGLMGPWGSGKTSVLNMVDELLTQREDTAVVGFNPWLFSGTEQLLLHFFRELSEQLQLKGDSGLKKAGQLIGDFGAIFAPLAAIPGVGPYMAGAAVASKTWAWLRKRRSGSLPSVDQQRKKIDEALRSLDKRVVILIDDIDRLQDNEIRTVMRLVRLTADFPNTVYVLAFDRERVEQCLGEDGIEGRAYLEKILQAGHDVPEARQPDIGTLLFAGINSVTQDRKTGPPHDEHLQNIYYFVLRPLFGTVRDVRRYCNSIGPTLDVLGEEVCLPDVLALEAMRVFIPESWKHLPALVDTLTTPSGSPGVPEPDCSGDLRKMIDAAGDRKDVVEELCKRVFPASQRHLGGSNYGRDWLSEWSKKRMAAHERVLEFYLQKSYPRGVLPATEIQELFESLGDAVKLEKLFSGWGQEEVEHALQRLQDYEKDFDSESVHVALPVIYRQTSRLREGRGRGFYDLGADFEVGSVVLRLLRRIDDESERVRVVKECLPQLSSLSEKHDLIHLVGHVKGAGHRLIPEAEAASLESKFCVEMKTKAASELIEERELGRLLSWFRKNGGSADQIRTWLEDRDLFVKYLRSLLDETTSQSLGDAAVRIDERLHWDSARELVGEDFLKQKVEELGDPENSTAIGDRSRKAIGLAKRYASGELPETNGGH